MRNKGLGVHHGWRYATVEPTHTSHDNDRRDQAIKLLVQSCKAKPKSRMESGEASTCDHEMISMMISETPM